MSYLRLDGGIGGGTLPGNRTRWSNEEIAQVVAEAVREDQIPNPETAI